MGCKCPTFSIAWQREVTAVQFAALQNNESFQMEMHHM